jgi:hypothetical protein
LLRWGTKFQQLIIIIIIIIITLLHRGWGSVSQWNRKSIKASACHRLELSKMPCSAVARCAPLTTVITNFWPVNTLNGRGDKGLLTASAHVAGPHDLCHCA